MPAEHVQLAVHPAAVRGAVVEKTQGPWSELDTDDVDRLLEVVTDELARHRELSVEHVESGSYGSGFASFVEVFVARPTPERHEEIVGLMVLLCRLAPFVCISNPSTTSPNTPSLPYQGFFLDLDDVSWQPTATIIGEIVRRHGLELLPPDVMARTIDPDITIDTNLGEPPFTVFDAWFHWWD